MFDDLRQNCREKTFDMVFWAGGHAQLKRNGAWPRLAGDKKRVPAMRMAALIPDTERDPVVEHITD